MANRNILHKSKLLEFKQWLIKNGHRLLDERAYHEVCRWKGEKGEAMPIIFSGDSSEHYSANHSATRYVRAFISDSNKGEG